MNESFFNYAQSLFKQGYGAKAIQSLEDLQLRFPASKYSDDSQYLIGWINFQSGNFDEAIVSIQNCSVIIPNQYYYQLLIILLVIHILT